MKALRSISLLLPILFSLACAALQTPAPLATATPQVATPLPSATPVPPSTTPAPTTTSAPSNTPGPTNTPIPPTQEPPEPGATRIRFAAGATSAQVEGSLQPSDGKTYVLWARAGQTLSTRLLPPVAGDPPAILIIWGEDGVPLITDHASATEFEGELPVSQDYYISVRANPTTAVDYTLEVVIPPPGPDEPVPIRIRFPPGATSTQVDGSLQPSEADRYVLWAAAGQTLSVRLLPPPTGEPEAILVIWGEDGVPLITDHASATEFEDVLPESQDYFIDVWANPTSAVEYTLEVVIPPPSG